LKIFTSLYYATVLEKYAFHFAPCTQYYMLAFILLSLAALQH